MGNQKKISNLESQKVNTENVQGGKKSLNAGYEEDSLTRRPGKFTGVADLEVASNDEIKKTITGKEDIIKDLKRRG